MVWFALAYALVGTWLTHIIGRPLIGLNFHQQKVRGQFPFCARARARACRRHLPCTAGKPMKCAI
jgi:putative ATP-binding cassette transporter